MSYQKDLETFWILRYIILKNADVETLPLNLKGIIREVPNKSSVDNMYHITQMYMSSLMHSKLLFSNHVLHIFCIICNTICGMVCCAPRPKVLMYYYHFIF